MNTQNSTYTSPVYRRYNRTFKRIFDVLMALIILLLIYPWAYIIIACCIKIKMPGKVMFTQRRTGRDGKAFICYKFRTMLPNQEADILQAYNDDPRITPFGKFLRITSLDELPQFWNVLIGNMSVVGPRPHMLAHTIQYSALIPEYNKRHEVKPGITGWAQVHNLRGETPDVCKMKKRVEYDIWYIHHWSFTLDYKIILYTLKMIFR